MAISLNIPFWKKKLNEIFRAYKDDKTSSYL